MRLIRARWLPLQTPKAKWVAMWDSFWGALLVWPCLHLTAHYVHFRRRARAVVLHLHATTTTVATRLASPLIAASSKLRQPSPTSGCGALSLPVSLDSLSFLSLDKSWLTPLHSSSCVAPVVCTCTGRRRSAHSTGRRHVRSPDPHLLALPGNNNDLLRCNFWLPCGLSVRRRLVVDGGGGAAELTL